MARSLRHALAGEAGMGLVEALVAATILLGGILGTLSVIDSSSNLDTVNERKQTAIHRAEQQLEKARAIGFVNLATTTHGTSTGSDDPRALIVSGTTYDWDASSATNTPESLVTSGTAQLNGHEPCDCGRYTGTVDTFVTLVSAELKRVTVAVKLDGTTAPRKATVVSTLISREARRTP